LPKKNANNGKPFFLSILSINQKKKRSIYTMGKTRAEKIDSIKEEITQLENRRKQLIQQEKAQERKDRTKRLCKRAGLLESLLPDTVPLIDELFKIFLEKTINTDHSRRILDGLTAQTAAKPAPPSAGSAARANTPPAQKPAKSEQGEDTDEGEERGNGARVNG